MMGPHATAPAVNWFGRRARSTAAHGTAAPCAHPRRRRTNQQGSFRERPSRRRHPGSSAGGPGEDVQTRDEQPAVLLS